MYCWISSWNFSTRDFWNRIIGEKSELNFSEKPDGGLDVSCWVNERCKE
jgi:hypothetical protein